MQECPKCHAKTVEWDARGQQFICLNRACCEAFKENATSTHAVADALRMIAFYLDNRFESPKFVTVSDLSEALSAVADELAKATA